MLEFRVNKEFEGLRLDKYLKEQNHETLYSRALIEKYISAQKVSINKKVCPKKSHIVAHGDVVNISMNVDKSSQVSSEIDLLEHDRIITIEKENIPLKIVYEDKYLAIIDKPAGLVVHPGAGNKNGTLVNALLYHFGNNLSHINTTSQTVYKGEMESGANKPTYRPGIVHRLDKDTTGLIIITKDDKTQFEMSQLFMKREIEKSYLGICLGVPSPRDGHINKAISRHKTNRNKMSVAENTFLLNPYSASTKDLVKAVNKHGKEAVTSYKTLCDLEYFSFLELKILTGRTHQIRVHLESIHHPILGDSVYNSIKRTLGSCPIHKQTAIKMFLQQHLQRQALHAWKLKFTHPISQKIVCVTADIPEDMQRTITFLKQNFVYYETV